MKKKLVISLLLFLLAISFTFAVKYLDVAPVGLIGTDIGFSSINKPIADILARNLTFYKISEFLGYLSFVIVGIYGVMALIQLIKRRSILKIDHPLIVLMGFYAVIFAIYILFNNIHINFRPIFVDAELEESFPSSHTILGITVCISSILVLKYYSKISDRKTVSNFRIVNFFSLVLAILLVLTRVLSGAHWATDIIGSALYSTALLFLFSAVLSYRKPKSQKQRKKASKSVIDTKPIIVSEKSKKKSKNVKLKPAQTKNSEKPDLNPKPNAKPKLIIETPISSQAVVMKRNKHTFVESKMPAIKKRKQ